MNEILAKSLGLRVELVPAAPEDGSLWCAFWRVLSAEGVYLGNWVPGTGSMFMNGAGVFPGHDDPDEVLRAFAAKRKGSGSRSVATAGPREVG